MLQASTVSRFLAANDLRPLPSGTSHAREGIRVKRSLRAVYVVADYDSTGEAKFMADELFKVLEARYDVQLTSDGTAMYVTEQVPA